MQSSMQFNKSIYFQKTSTLRLVHVDELQNIGCMTGNDTKYCWAIGLSSIQICNNMTIFRCTMTGVFCLFSYLHKNYGLLSITEAYDTVKRHGIHAVFDSAFCGCLYRLTGGLPV